MRPKATQASALIGPRGVFLCLLLAACPPRKEPLPETTSAEDTAAPRSATGSDKPAAAPTPAGKDAAARVDETEDDNAPGLGVVLATYLNVRKEPRKTRDPVLEVIRCGDIIGLSGVAGEGKDWFLVKTTRTEAGYIYGSYVTRLHPGSHRPECASLKRLRPMNEKEISQPIPKEQAKISQNPGLAPAPKDPANFKPVPEPDPRTPAARDEPPPSLAADPIILDKKGERDPVRFPHNQAGHQRYKCFRCHHPASGKGGAAMAQVTLATANVEKRCHTCHNDQGKVKAREAFHDTCRDCHRVEGRGKAPTGCDGCHKK